MKDCKILIGILIHDDLPFNPSALSLYKWAPIAEELKTLDRKIVLNSVILKMGCY